MLQVKKLKEHVYQKILKLDENQNSTNESSNSNAINSENSNNTQRPSSSTNSLSNSSSNGSNPNDSAALANRTIELICSDNVSRTECDQVNMLFNSIWIYRFLPTRIWVWEQYDIWFGKEVAIWLFCIELKHKGDVFFFI